MTHSWTSNWMNESNVTNNVNNMIGFRIKCYYNSIPHNVCICKCIHFNLTAFQLGYFDCNTNYRKTKNLTTTKLWQSFSSASFGLTQFVPLPSNWRLIWLRFEQITTKSPNIKIDHWILAAHCCFNLEYMFCAIWHSLWELLNVFVN